MKDWRYIAEMVKNTNIPLALTRLGDGESRILNFGNDKPSANHSLRKHMGRICLFSPSFYKRRYKGTYSF